MICEVCASYADVEAPGSWHTDLSAKGLHCEGGTHCDCQHKEPGTAVNKELIDVGQAD